jgi:acetyltransferase
LKTGKLFFMALLDQGFSGDIYPVSPLADEIEGFKAYPTVTAIPGAVDLAIILVPQRQILSAVKECAAKGIKGAVLFTAGYKETGTDEGRAQEEQLVQVAHRV